MHKISHPSIRALSISLVLFVFAVTAIAQSTTFSNTTPISLFNESTSAPFPSTINVANLGGTLTKVTITLNSVNEDRGEDLNVLLVGPGGQAVALIQDAGNGNSVSGQTFTFDDGAAGFAPIGTSLTGGTYKPTDGNQNHGDFFAPAPAGPYSGVLSDLIGTSPNGNWSLYVEDDSSNGIGGVVAGGWTLTLTTGAVAKQSNAINITDNAASIPFPSTVVVSNAGAVSKVTIRLNGFSHDNPDDVGLLLVGPTGVAVRLSTDNGGNFDVNNIDLVFDSTAANTLHDYNQVIETTYRPSQGTVAGGGLLHNADFQLPAPMGPYSTDLGSFVGTNADGLWSLYVDDDTYLNSGIIAGGWTLMIQGSGATAAGVSISGRLTNSSGRGIAKSYVSLSGAGLASPRMTLTNAFGYYAFEGVEVGHTYVVSAKSKQHRFSHPTRVVSVDDAVSGLDFIAEP